MGPGARWAVWGLLCAGALGAGRGGAGAPRPFGAPGSPGSPGSPEPWSCPLIEGRPAVECSCDLPHTLRCAGDRSALQIIGRTLRSLPAHAAVSLLDCTVQNVSALAGALLEGVALHGLVVSSGEIRDVHSAAFRGLAAPLQALGLPNNQLTSVPTAALAQLEGLDRLDLSHNLLGSISTESFVGLSTLTFLELSDNELEELAAGAFKPLGALSTLRLGGNRLGAGALASLRALGALRELDLGGNLLGGPLGPSTLPALPALRSLSLANNKLTSVKRGALAGLVNLTSLSLNNNEIDVIEDHAFRQLSNLTELDLAHNGIVAVSGSSLSHLVRLQKLDLSHNFLRALTADLVRPLLSLRELRLDDNDISIVAADALSANVSLDRLTLAENPLNCDCSVSQFALWLRGAARLSAPDRASAACATPPDLEGARLRALGAADLGCAAPDEAPRGADYGRDADYDDDEDDGSRKDDEEPEVAEEQLTLTEFRYDGALVQLRWAVRASAGPYSCDAVFVYEEAGASEALLSSEPLHCDSAGMADPGDLRVTVPGSRDLHRGHSYRYCVALLRGPRDSDQLQLLLGCSDVIPLHPTVRGGELRKEPAVRVSGVRSNVTSDGSLSIEISLFGYPPSRPQNLLSHDGYDPSPEQIAEYFEALNSCYVSLAVFAQGSLIAQRDTECARTSVRMEGFMQGPYRVCASLSEFQVTGPNSKCVSAQKVAKGTAVESSAVRGLNVILMVACAGLVTAVVALVWASRKLLKKPKQPAQSQQCFRPAPQACEEAQHSGYVKLHATTKL